MFGNLLLSPWTCVNRDMVRAEKEKGITYALDKDEYIGHIYTDTGHYTTYYLKAGIDNIARFICSSNQDKFLTSGMDRPVLTTINQFLDIACLEKDEQEILINLINQYQKSKEKITFDYKK